ncbi:MAG: L-seryl-tRNA(Sec) selenium transferase, partial [Spirochaetales bacterium]|nr:L-seryl-tRNA(Sec) selenium transferase [Spirochaetales bacterium]
NYSNLEMSLDTGKRDRRGGILGELLSYLLGCESSTVVNNCAAALYLVLASLASNREVIVSRGEQVQIGGGFRIPEILRQSGAKLVEVGTTNITRAEDYAEAVGPDTAMVLLVHTSNFEIRGFTQKPTVADISKLIPPEVIIAVDQGAGITTETIPDETKAARYFEDGADLVCFSGDKVLGGPQAGLISGKRDLIETIEKHPMMRVLRSGKTIRSLLEEHLVQKLNGTVRGRAEEISSIPADELLKRGEALIENIPIDCASVVESVGAIGGGSAPGKTFPTYSIRLDCQARPETLLLELRSCTPPIVGTISDGSVLLNLSTITSEELSDVAAAITALHEAKFL